MDTDTREKIWQHICGVQGLLVLMLTFDIVLLFLAAFSFVFVDRESSSYVILQIDFILLCLLFFPLVYVLLQCRKR